MKKLILIGLSCIVISCKKDGSYPIKFYGERVDVKSATRLFSHVGEIKDPSKIAAFIKGAEIFNGENDTRGKGNLVVELVSPDSALFIQNNYKFSIKKTDDQFLFYSSVAGGLPNTNFTDFKYNLLKHTYSAPISGPLGTFTVPREVRIAYGNWRELRFRRVAYLATSRNYGNFSSASGLANNEFNEAALSLMKPGDTLAIKVYDVVCKVK